MSEPPPPTPTHKRQIAGVESGFFIAAIAADIPRMILIGLAPLLLSAYAIDRGFGEKVAAWLSSAELLSAAIAAIAISGWLTHGSRRKVAAIGLLLVIAGQLFSMFRFDFVPLLGLRLIVGVGAGLAGAASTSAAAGTAHPERVFAAMGFAVALLGAITAGPIGMAIEAFGAAGAFAIATALTALAVPMLRQLPDPPPIQRTVDGAPQYESSAPHAITAIVVLAALFTSMLGQNAVWGFTVQIGLSTGLNISTTSWVLALTALTGLGGAALASLLNTRHGRTAPLLLSILGTVVSVYMLVSAKSPLPYIIGNGAWSFFFAFSMPYFIGTLATLDPRGRWATIGTGLAGIGAALGPAATGAFVETNGYSVLSSIVVGTGAISAILLAPVLIKIDRLNPGKSNL